MAERERAGVQVAERQSAAPSSTRPAQGGQRLVASLRTTVLLFLAICIVGVGPLLVVNGIFGSLRVDVPPLPGFSILTPTASVAPDLALPRQAWTAAQVTMVAQVGGSSALAMLEPGFPVTITAHQWAGGALWSHITWSGPTRAAGGEGWARDSAFVSYGGQGRAIGDVGALSPQLLKALAPYGSRFAAALYFPDSGQLYRTRATQSFALGEGFRSVLLVTLFAQNEEQKQLKPSVAAVTSVAQVANGDATATAFAYAAVGDAAGINTYLTKKGITGIQPAQGDWLGAQATPSGLLQFYTALDARQMLNDTDRAAVVTQLSRITSPASTAMSSILAPGHGGLLVVGTAQAQGAGNWTMSAAGIIAPAKGPHVVLATAVRDQPTQAAAQAALVTFYRQLATLLAAA